MSTKPVLRMGTRASPLALAQAGEVREALAAHSPDLAAPGAIEIVNITTSGDRIQDRPLAQVGGKGLFAKELHAALRDGRIDMAVHSLKDLETTLPPGLTLAACLAREDPRDCLIAAASGVDSLAALPPGALIGTASLRRQAQLLHRRRDLRMTLLRGNIETRMNKIAEGAAQATVMAIAGLKRLGLVHRASCILDPEDMLPACAQGTIGIICRTGDARSGARLQAISHPETLTRITAERALLAALDGSCQTPIGGLAEISAAGTLRLRGLVARPDGTELFRAERTGAAADAVAIGRDLGAELRARAGAELFW